MFQLDDMFSVPRISVLSSVQFSSVFPFLWRNKPSEVDYTFGRNYYFYFSATNAKILLIMNVFIFRVEVKQIFSKQEF